MERKYVLILSVLMIIFLMGSASAANTTNIKHSNSQNISNQHFKLISNHYNSTTTVKKVNSTKNQIVPGYGCCSVLAHVKKGYNVYSFRRDSVYTANLYIKKTNWYGKDALEEYKTTGGYFFHTIIPRMDGYLGQEVLIFRV